MRRLILLICDPSARNQPSHTRRQISCLTFAVCSDQKLRWEIQQISFLRRALSASHILSVIRRPVYWHLHSLFLYQIVFHFSIVPRKLQAVFPGVSASNAFQESNPQTVIYLCNPEIELLFKLIISEEQFQISSPLQQILIHPAYLPETDLFINRFSHRGSLQDRAPVSPALNHL